MKRSRLVVLVSLLAVAGLLSTWGVVGSGGGRRSPQASGSANPTSTPADTTLGPRPAQTTVADTVETPAVLSPGTDPGAGDEVTSYRDAYTRTATDRSGAAVTQVFFTPVNYRSSSGEWLPIDSMMVPADGGWRWSADKWSAFLPTRMSDRSAPAMTLPSGGSLVISLAGSNSSVATVDGPSVTYPDVLPGVDMVDEVGLTGMNSDLVLSSTTAGSTFEFDAAVSDDLQLSGVGGSIVVSAALGDAVRFAAPSARDAAGAESVTKVDVVGNRLTVSIDEQWLSSPARVWPVVLNSVVTLSGSTAANDCYISAAAPTFNACANTTIAVGYGSDGFARRALLRFPTIARAVPVDDIVDDATLGLYLNQNSSAAPSTLAAYRVTQPAWTTGVSWATFDGTSSWATAGGDFDTTTDRYVNESGAHVTTSGSLIGDVNFSVTNLVRDWLDGTVADAAVLIEAIDPSVHQLNSFRSDSFGTPSQQPRLLIHHHPRVGIQSAYTYKSWVLDDQLGASVNLANGNLAVSAADLNITGKGLDLAINRTYNSADHDAGWSWSMGADMRLEIYPDGNVTYLGGDQHRFPFIKRAGSDGGSEFFKPPLIAATLTAHPSSSAGAYELRFDTSDVVYVFDQVSPSLAVLRQVRDRDGNNITISYGASNEWSTIVDTQGRTVTATWTSGRLENITDSTGRVVDYVYNASGQLTSVIDAAGGTTDYTYNGASGLMETITTPAKETIRFTFSAQAVTLVEEVVDSAKPDASDSHDTSLSYSLHALGNGETSVTDARGKVWVYDWDRRDRVVTQTKPNGDVSTTTFTSDDQVSSSGPSAKSMTSTAYDATTNDVLSITAPSSDGVRVAAVTSSDYSTGLRGRPSSVVDPRGNCQRNAYDTRGHLTDTFAGLVPANGRCDISTSGPHTAIAYNADGTVAAFTDPMGAATRYGYDTVGNLTSIDYPGSLGRWGFTVDTLSRPTSVTDGRGMITRYAYDNLDRPTKIATNDTSLAACTVGGADCSLYTYDPDGHLTVRADATGTTVFRYNRLGWLMSEQLPGNADACTTGTTSIEFTYSPVGDLSTLCDSAGTVAYAYDAARRNLSVREPGGDCATHIRCTTFTYDSSNRRQIATYPGGTTHTIFYDNAGNIRQIVATSLAASTIFNRTYTWYTGNRDTAQLQSTSQRLAGIITNYAYDRHNWLTAAVNTADSYSWTYDANSNRLTELHNGATTTAAYTAASLLCWTNSGTVAGTCAAPPTGAVTYTYDANGNMTGNSVGDASTYNAANQSTTWDALTMNYSASDQSERTKVGATDLYNFSALGTIGANTAGALMHYFYNATGERIGYQNGSSATHYYLTDYLGSTTAVVDDAGVVLGRIAYAPWGAQTSNTLPAGERTPFGYEGGYTDDPATRIKFGYRYYDPILGRWTQADPAGYADGTNRQIFAGNNPLDIPDPNGRSSDTAVGGPIPSPGLVGRRLDHRT